jgi:hypothetical protein
MPKPITVLKKRLSTHPHTLFQLTFGCVEQKARNALANVTGLTKDPGVNP